jgi:hypothetical protein
MSVRLQRPGIVGILALLVLLLCAAPAPAAPDPASLLTLRIDSVTPDVVTTSSEPTVTVNATVTNVGDRTVRDVAARFEHGPAVDSAAALRTSLYIGGQFTPVGDFIGGTALTRQRMITGAVALTDTTIVSVPREAMNTVVQQDHRLARQIGDTIDMRRDSARAALLEAAQGVR